MAKAPQWVEEYPYEMDRAALTQLAESTIGNFDKPREMNFSLYDFTVEADLQEAARRAAEAGWHCQAFRQSDDPDKLTLQAQKADYRISKESYERDSKFFMRLADDHQAKYDGWFASQ